MNFHPYSIEQAPCTVPVWESILEDLGHPPAPRVARVLGVSQSTVYRWNAEGSGPRVACLALFWLTRWGRSAVHTQATNDATMAIQLARSLGEDRDALQRQVQALDLEARRLAWSLATITAQTTTHQAPARDSAAIAGPSHRDTGPGASWGPEAAPAAPPPGGSMAWPVLDPVQPQQALTAPPPEHPGSRAAPPPAAHSTRCPAPGRTGPPPPSGPREVLQSWPLASVRCQSNAILPPHEG